MAIAGQSENRGATFQKRQGLAPLILCAAALAAIWLVVLPWIGRQPDLAERIRHQREAGIDPGAMFYTELELMPAVIRRLERIGSLTGPLTPSAGPCNSPGSRRIPTR
jgi:hypothetical protein